MKYELLITHLDFRKTYETSPGAAKHKLKQTKPYDIAGQSGLDLKCYKECAGNFRISNKTLFF